MTDTKLMFFDIDGTILSEETGKIPETAIQAIRKARENGHQMFVNSGRCFQNIDPYIRSIGFDGFICGCGTHIIYHGSDLFYTSQTPKTSAFVVSQALRFHLDAVFEARTHLAFPPIEALRPNAIKLYQSCLERGYDLSTDIFAPGFTFDKFVLWIEKDSDFVSFLQEVSPYFECIDRSSNFKEFVPKGFSKASGIAFLLDYLNMPLDHAYAIGDSNNDLPMLDYVPHSIAMGNSQPQSLFERVSYVTKPVEEDGVAHALKHFHFFETAF